MKTKHLILGIIFLFAISNSFASNGNESRESLSKQLIKEWLDGNDAKIVDLTQQMYSLNSYDLSVLKWAHNITSEIGQNGALMIKNSSEIVPILIVQYAKNTRKDVQLLNYEFYKSNPLYKKQIDLYLKGNKLNTKNKTLFVQSVSDHAKNVHLSFSEIQSIDAQSEIKNHLYLTGLTYQYSKTQIDNTSIIRRNYEKRYYLEQLDDVFRKEINENEVNRINETYLPSLLKLYKHYIQTEEHEKGLKIADRIAKIGSKSGQKQAILEILKPNQLAYDQFEFLTADLKYRDLEKSMKAVQPNLYFSNHEVTNEEYSKFLQNLIQSDKIALYDKVLYDSTQWYEKFPVDFNTPMQKLYHNHSAYNDYPVVNISHESAQMYCKWLTEQYNTQRKRNFTKVIFRLPTNEEWEQAAKGKKSDAKYGLLNDALINENKCYLANIQPEKGRYFDDGGFHTVKVSSYICNDFELFNTIGNVAEMIQTKGIAKGGCWYTLPEESTIQSKLKYDKEDPGVGFRLVMEVIEK